jgi:hypothetical protein
MRGPAVGASFSGAFGTTYTAGGNQLANVNAEDFLDALANGWLLYNAQTSSSASIPNNPFSVTVKDATPGSAVNDYSPTGLTGATSRIIMTAASGGTVMSGLNSTGFQDGAEVLVVNASVTDYIELLDSSNLSAAANRLILPGGGPTAIQFKGSALFVLDLQVFNCWTIK